VSGSASFCGLFSVTERLSGNMWYPAIDISSAWQAQADSRKSTKKTLFLGGKNDE
jgi:hypothetical protein